jgi:hypothetical protein
MTALTPEQQAALEQLRDIRLPDPIGWWPLAPGWWALAGLLLLAIAATLGWSVLWKRTRRWLALHELAALRRRLDADAAASVASDLAALIRRVALATDGHDAARLTDDEWAEALAAGKAGFPREAAGLVASSPYIRPDTLTTERLKALFAPAEAWIRRTA